MNSHSIEILMPMAGLGQRFKKEGFNTPKPLIDFKGKPIFQRALLSLSPIFSQSRISFIICKEDNITDSIQSIANSMNINFQIIELDSRTKGPAETILKSRNSIDNNLSLLSIDCDLAFSSKKYFEIIEQHKKNKISGALCYFSSDNPRFSYIQTNENDQAVGIAEKKVISKKALLGSYFFSKGSTLFNTIDSLLDRDAEVFLSHAIKDMINKDHTFLCCSSDKYTSFGTPEEIKKSSKSTEQ